MDLDLAQSAALVTGASKGIGLAIVRGLAAEGARVRRRPPWSRTAAARIVNIFSTHALVPSAVNVPCGAAKAALRNLSQALSEELGPHGVRVNTVWCCSARRARAARPAPRSSWTGAWSRPSDRSRAL